MITIKSNDRGRYFLVFDTLFDLDNNPDFQDSMFNAVYIASTSLSETITILGSINPITSRKCCYKPFFVSKKHEGKLGGYAELVDGYIYDINDTDADQQTESILATLNETGIQRVVDDLSSSNLLFIRLLRFYISRKKQQLVPVLMEGSNLGYALPVMSIFYDLGLYRHREYIIFMQTMFEKGYLRATKFLNKVYLCPSCMHSHLLYVETCPKCGCSNIKSEEVIHHFRCANISPESAYNYGGQLRCPKCHKLLRHIGVDYDRPSTVYYCKSCANNFLQPKMTAICTHCSKESNISELVSNDVVAYEITEKGKHELISTHVYGSIYTEFYDNYIEYSYFTNRIKLSTQQARFDGEQADISVVQIWLLDAQNATLPLKSEFISYICELFPYNNISFANYMLYIKCVEHTGGVRDIDEFILKLKESLGKLAAHIHPGEVLCYSKVSLNDMDEMGLDNFISRLDFVPQSIDGYFEYNASDSVENVAPLISPVREYDMVQDRMEPVESGDDDTENGLSQESVDKKTPKYRLWVILLLVFILLLAGYLFFMKSKSSEGQDPMAMSTDIQPKSELIEDTQAPEAMTQQLGHEAGASNTVEADATALQPVAEGNSAAGIVQCVDGRHYVVSGSFRSYENAVKQKEYMHKQLNEFSFTVYCHGDKYIISPFESDDRDECSRFIVSNRSHFPDAWVL